EDAARGTAELYADWVGILAQPITGQCGADCLEHPRRRRIRVLVRVQFDEHIVARLLARRVAGHDANILPDEISHRSSRSASSQPVFNPRSQAELGNERERGTRGRTLPNPRSIPGALGSIRG